MAQLTFDQFWNDPFDWKNPEPLPTITGDSLVSLSSWITLQIGNQSTKRMPTKKKCPDAAKPVKPACDRTTLKRWTLLSDASDERFNDSRRKSGA